MDAREPTFGERAVRLSFNVSGDSVVNDLKVKAAAFIDACEAIRQDTRSTDDAVRATTLAITNAEQACMWAVKAATAKAS